MKTRSLIEYQMAEIKEKFARLRLAVEIGEPTLLPLLDAYKPDLWTTRERAEELYAEIRENAKRGVQIVDTEDYSKWENGEFTFERRNKNLSLEHISVRGDMKIILSNSFTGYGEDTSLQTGGQIIWWSENAISIRAGYTTIADYQSYLQFKACIGGVKYWVDVYEDGAGVTKKSTFLFFKSQLP
jgi:hypothetical protein